MRQQENSPKLCTHLGDTCKRADLNEHGININGEKLTHLRFTEDIDLLIDSIDDIMIMLKKMYHASKEIGLKLIMSHVSLKENF